MNSKRIWSTLLMLSSLGPHFPGVWAQLSDMAVCPTGWQWNQNSLGQDPCAISSILDAACRGVGSYTIPPLNSTQNYVPPQKDSTADLTCDCDTVMYSLYMACSTCQGGTIYSWTTWIAQCQTVYVTQYPHDIPYGTAIPHWAFYDVTTLPSSTYSDSVAISAGRDPEATPKALNTATYKTSTSSRSGSIPSSGSGSDPTSTSDSSSGSKLPLVPIIGGAAGGVVVLILTAVVVAICLKRRKKVKGNQPPPQLFPPQDTSEYQEYQKVRPVSPMLSPVTGNLPYNNGPTSPNPLFNAPAGYNPPFPAPPGPDPSFNAPANPNPSFNPPAGQNPQQFNGAYYNPEDPTTFPPPMSDGTSSVTYTNPGPGRYGGMPEL